MLADSSLLFLCGSVFGYNPVNTRYLSSQSERGMILFHVSLDTIFTVEAVRELS